MQNAYNVYVEVSMLLVMCDRSSSLILNTLADATATPDDLLAVLRDEHRRQREYDPGADPDANLTFDSSIEKWRITCDLLK